MGIQRLNYHWEMRQYTFQVVGGLYKVDEMELRDLDSAFCQNLLNS